MQTVIDIQVVQKNSLQIAQYPPQNFFQNIIKIKSVNDSHLDNFDNYSSFADISISDTVSTRHQVSKSREVENIACLKDFSVNKQKIIKKTISKKPKCLKHKKIIKNYDQLSQELKKYNLNKDNFKNIFEVKNNNNIYNVQLTSKEQYIDKKNSCGQNQSVFRNQNKILMTKIINFLSLSNLKNMQIPTDLIEKIIKVINNIKDTGRVKEHGSITKSDLYNHSHYNLMFLQINEQSIKYMANSPHKFHDYKQLYQQVFGLDLCQNVSEQQINEINLIKECLFQIVKKYIFNKPLFQNYELNQNQLNVTDIKKIESELQYEYMAYIGISKMNKYQFVQRF